LRLRPFLYRFDRAYIFFYICIFKVLFFFLDMDSFFHPFSFSEEPQLVNVYRPYVHYEGLSDLQAFEVQNSPLLFIASEVFEVLGLGDVEAEVFLSSCGFISGSDYYYMNIGYGKRYYITRYVLIRLMLERDPYFLCKEFFVYRRYIIENYNLGVFFENYYLSSGKDVGFILEALAIDLLRYEALCLSEAYLTEGEAEKLSSLLHFSKVELLTLSADCFVFKRQLIEMSAYEYNCESFPYPLYVTMLLEHIRQNNS
jgi:hypothetical protein